MLEWITMIDFKKNNNFRIQIKQLKNKKKKQSLINKSNFLLQVIEIIKIENHIKININFMTHNNLKFNKINNNTIPDR